MNTIIAKAGVDDDRMYEQAAEILKRGGLVAFPTETVYGLGGDALNPDASHRMRSRADIFGKRPAAGQSAHSPYSRDIKRV